MPLNDQDARALTYLAMRVRAETHGAGPWDEHGTYANVAKLAGRNLAITAEHILRHAADPKAKNPGVLLGRFTPAAPVEDNRAVPPRSHEVCRAHPAQRAESCPWCVHRVKAWDEDEPADLAPLPPAATPAEAARVLLAQTRAALCGCGVDRLTCPQHRPAAATEETADE